MEGDMSLKAIRARVDAGCEYEETVYFAYLEQAALDRAALLEMLDIMVETVYQRGRKQGWNDLRNAIGELPHVPPIRASPEPVCAACALGQHGDPGMLCGCPCHASVPKDGK